MSKILTREEQIQVMSECFKDADKVEWIPDSADDETKDSITKRIEKYTLAIASMFFAYRITAAESDDFSFSEVIDQMFQRKKAGG